MKGIFKKFFKGRSKSAQEDTLKFYEINDQAVSEEEFKAFVKKANELNVGLYVTTEMQSTATLTKLHTEEYLNSKLKPIKVPVSINGVELAKIISMADYKRRKQGLSEGGYSK